MNLHKIGGTFVVALALFYAFSGTTLAAESNLLSRVNEALRLAGLPVNEQTQQSFAAGVASGHYTTFEQLVNAMKWHKANGKWTANAQAFNVKNRWTFTGTVTEVNSTRLEMTGVNTQGVTVWPKFRITDRTRVRNGILFIDANRQTRRDVMDEIRRGSVVKVWATPSHEALVIKNLAPVDQGDFYGPVDCTWCAEGVNHSDNAESAPQEEVIEEEEEDQDQEEEEFEEGF